MYGRVALFVCSVHLVNSYVVPEATVEVLSPKGLSVSIPGGQNCKFLELNICMFPERKFLELLDSSYFEIYCDSPGITLFAFHGKINEDFDSLEVGQMARDVIKKQGDRWVFEDTNVKLRKGDILYYWLYVIFDGLGYKGLGRKYTVTGDSVTTSLSNSTMSCFNSPTRVNGKVQCSGSIIFEKYFTEKIVDNTWSHEIQFGGNDLVDEFVIFKNDPLNSFILENNIVIKPRLLDDEKFITSGQLVLKGCTSYVMKYCEKKAATYLIIPPVLSARLTTKNSFSFMYGIVEIKAKLPKGDWIVPELWLQSKELTQDSKPVKVILGLARGNKHLSCQGKDMSNRLLEAGTMYNDKIIFEKVRSTEWSQDFHLYKVIWNPNGLIFKVDNEEIGRIDSSVSGNELSTLDKEFHISIGVHVGGVQDFPDSCLSGDHVKPWVNSNPKRMLNFWLDKTSWFPTWNDDSALRIEYIKVWAF